MPHPLMWERAFAPELDHLLQACTRAQSTLVLSLPGGGAAHLLDALAKHLPLCQFTPTSPPPLTPPSEPSPPWTWQIAPEVEDGLVTRTLEFCRRHSIGLVLWSPCARRVDTDHLLCLSSLPPELAKQLFLAASAPGSLDAPPSQAELDALLTHTAGIPALIAQLARHSPLLTPPELTHRIRLGQGWQVMDPQGTFQTQLGRLYGTLPLTERTLLSLAAHGAHHTLCLTLAEHLQLADPAPTRDALLGLIQAGWLVRRPEAAGRFRLLAPYAQVIQELAAPCPTREDTARSFAGALARWRAAATPPQEEEEDTWKGEGESAARACAILCEAKEWEAAAQCALVVHFWVKEAGPFPLGRLHLEAVATGLEATTDDVLYLEVLEALSFPNYHATQESSGTLWARRALEQSVARGRLSRAVRIGSGLAYMLYYEGDFAQARHVAHQTFEAAKAEPSLRLRCTGLEVASVVEFFLGDLATARVRCDQAVELWVRHPDLQQDAQVTSSLAWNRAMVLGHLDASIRMLDRVHDLTTHPYLRCLAHTAMASLHLQAGRPERALLLAAQALEAAEPRTFQELITTCHMVQGVAALEAGRAEDARTHFLHSARHLDAHYNATSSLMVAACDMALGQLDLARARLDPLLHEEPSVWPWEHMAPWFMFAALAYPESSNQAAALRQKARRWPVGRHTPGYPALLDVLEGIIPADPGQFAHLSPSVRPLRQVATPFLHTTRPHAPTLHVGPRASWFGIGAQDPQSLGRRGAIRRVFHALCLQREASPGEPLSVFELFELGWPGQPHVAPELATHRVYNAMSSLRGMGLEALLVRDDSGYALDPRVVLQWED